MTKPGEKTGGVASRLASVPLLVLTSALLGSMVAGAACPDQPIAACRAAGPGAANGAGQVELKLKAPWHDATTQLVMSPLEFMQRLATLVLRATRQRPVVSDS